VSPAIPTDSVSTKSLLRTKENVFAIAADVNQPAALALALAECSTTMQLHRALLVVVTFDSHDLRRAR
jgi:hypothetical protein